MKTDWPPFDAGPESSIPFIFGKPLHWAEDIIGRATCLPRFDDHDQWDRYIQIATFARLAKKLCFPFDLTQNEQPGQVGKLWPLPIHSDQSDNEIEVIVNRGLYVLWLVRAEELADSLPTHEALREIQLMSEKLFQYYGSGNRVWRECQREQVTEWATWLKCTHGGFDMASGALTDEGGEVAAMREFDMNGGAA
jgi:hypothetical protein